MRAKAGCVMRPVCENHARSSRIGRIVKFSKRHVDEIGSRRIVWAAGLHDRNDPPAPVGVAAPSRDFNFV